MNLSLNVLNYVFFLSLLFRVDCIEKNELLSLTLDDFWPNQIISSTNGRHLELITGLPYAFRKGCDGSLVNEVVILPTLNENQYLIKIKGKSNWFGRTDKTRYGKGIADFTNYYANWNGKDIIRLLLANDETSEAKNVDNRYYWTLDKKSSDFYGINSCLYTYKIVAHCGNIPNICSKPRKVDGGYVAPYYSCCYTGIENFNYKFEPLFDYPLQLEASIYDIKYETNLENIIEKYSKQRVTLLNQSTINNNNQEELHQIVGNSRTLTDEFHYDFHDSWSNFHSVHVDIGASETANTGIFGLFSEGILVSINSGHKYENHETSGWGTNKTTSKSKVYSISKNVTVPPYSNMNVFSYVNFIENMSIKVKLLFKIRSTALRENLNYKEEESPLDADVVEYLMRQRGFNSRIKIVGREHDAVLAELHGNIIASFGLDTVFDAKIEEIQEEIPEINIQ